MTDEKAREILKKHAAIYGDSRYEPASWVLAAIHDAVQTCDAQWLQACALEDSAAEVARRMGYPEPNKLETTQR